ncbi:MAG TPA: M28 family peptidase [Coriobacteriia bacterium]
MSGEMTHVMELAERIGPRPATTDAEADAADYIQGVFEARGLEVERQEFDSPRTYSWAYALYHVLTLASAVASRWFPAPALVAAGVTAIVFWLDLDTRFGLTSIMPKGPSQNLIARHVPRVGRNERAHRIVVVAHYDSARASLAFAPGMVRGFATTFGLMKACTIAVPVLILLAETPWLRDLPGVWALVPWYVTLAASAYLLIPLVINVHRELFMKPVPGANDNASGVAAMLGVMERVVPEPDLSSVAAKRVQRTEDAVAEVDVMPGDAVLTYAPTETPMREPEVWAGADEDIEWNEPARAGLGQTTMDVNAAPVTRPPAPVPGSPPGDRPSRVSPLDGDLFGSAELFGEEPVAREAAGAETGAEHNVRDWLGVGKDFDARKEGASIGSWDNFADDDEDETGWKGGSAAIEALDDPDFAASEAARIRRRVTQTVDRDLAEKEIWFVATGAEEVGTFGMRAFLKQFGPEMRDATIINIDNVGNGTVHYVTSEGMARRYRSDRRLLGAARRAVTEDDLAVRDIDYRGLSTDATPALARGFRAMSVMAFDINGRLPDWHWQTDTVENVDEANLTSAAEFVCAVMRAL